MLALSSTGNPNHTLRFIHVLNGVGKQVLKYLLNTGWLYDDGWQGILNSNVNIRRRGEEINHVLYYLTDFHCHRRLSYSAYPRVLQNTIDQISHAVHSTDEEAHMFFAFVIEFFRIVGGKPIRQCTDG